MVNKIIASSKYLPEKLLSESNKTVNNETDEFMLDTNFFRAFRNKAKTPEERNALRSNLLTSNELVSHKSISIIPIDRDNLDINYDKLMTYLDDKFLDKSIIRNIVIDLLFCNIIKDEIHPDVLLINNLGLIYAYNRRDQYVISSDFNYQDVHYINVSTISVNIVCNIFNRFPMQLVHEFYNNTFYICSYKCIIIRDDKLNLVYMHPLNGYITTSLLCNIKTSYKDTSFILRQLEYFEDIIDNYDTLDEDITGTYVVTNNLKVKDIRSHKIGSINGMPLYVNYTIIGGNITGFMSLINPTNKKCIILT